MNKTKQGKTMTYAVAINSSGQATIPKDIRDLLGIVPGENRLTFDIKEGKVVLGKEKSRREQFMKNMEKIWRREEAEVKRNPKYRQAREEYKYMTPEEIEEAYYATEEGKKELKEKYGIEL